MEDLIFEDAVNTENTENEEKQPELTPEEKKEQRKQKIKAEIIDWAKTIFFYCVVPLTVFQIFCFMANVPTGSMESTIPVGAQVLTTRCFDKNDIERGDIVVFESDELDIILIKRCIGLPGETITFDGSGAVFVNGGMIYEPYVSSYSSFTGEFVVPEDCYFFLGDNRGGSLDARFWENPYIHKDEIKGKARFILFPFSSFGQLK